MAAIVPTYFQNKVEVTNDLLSTIMNDIFDKIGTGHNESTYSNAFKIALNKHNIQYAINQMFPVYYEDKIVGHNTIDLILNDNLIVQFKNTSVSESDINKLKYFSNMTGMKAVIIQLPNYYTIIDTTTPLRKDKTEPIFKILNIQPTSIQSAKMINY